MDDARLDGFFDRLCDDALDNPTGGAGPDDRHSPEPIAWCAICKFWRPEEGPDQPPGCGMCWGAL